MIESPQNEKLKLVRKLRERKHREREGLSSARARTWSRPGWRRASSRASCSPPPAASWAARRSSPSCLPSVSALGSGTRAIAVWPQRWAEPGGPPCVYLHGVGDPGNVGTIVRTAHALLDGTVVLGPDCADPFSPKAVRASMGSIFGQPVPRGGRGDAGATGGAGRSRRRGP